MVKRKKNSKYTSFSPIPQRYTYLHDWCLEALELTSMQLKGEQNVVARAIVAGCLENDCSHHRL